MRGVPVIRLNIFADAFSKTPAAQDDLTWAEVEAGVPHQVFEGNSGRWYPDQEEITWERLTKDSGANKPIMEITSVTKLPRRVATFSAMNVLDVLEHNMTEDGIVLSVNFANYVDAKLTGARGRLDSPKFNEWADRHLSGFKHLVHFIGTGALTDDTIHAPGGIESRTAFDELELTAH